MKATILPVLLSSGLLIGSAKIASAAGPLIADLKEYPNASGSSRSFSPFGALDTRNPFFQSLGSNGLVRELSSARRGLDNHAGRCSTAI
jgi:hypothetical protein